MTINKKETPIVSFRNDETIVESVFNHENQKVLLAIYQNGKVDITSKYTDRNGNIYVPYSADNHLIKGKIVILPNDVSEYPNKEKLLMSIKNFIYKYVDLHDVFLDVATHYVLLSWVFDSFGEIPYLRLKGEFGTGKTRFLQTVGNLCYRPIFSSGASSTAPLFHILDKVGGTLILDEADFRFSDEKSDITKILNNGNTKGFPVLRCQGNSKGEYKPVGYNVYSPKIVATRNIYDDNALESRFITQDTTTRDCRKNIPTTLPVEFYSEAEKIRNMLLMFRFKNLDSIKLSNELLDENLEGRVKQMFLPLLSVVSDSKVRESFISLAHRINEEIQIDRGLDTSAQILRVIKSLTDKNITGGVSITEINKEFCKKHENDYQYKITPKWIGTFIRKKLNLRTTKSTNGRYVIASSEGKKLQRLYDKYQIASNS